MSRRLLTNLQDNISNRGSNKRYPTDVYKTALKAFWEPRGYDSVYLSFVLRTNFRVFES